MTGAGSTRPRRGLRAVGPGALLGGVAAAVLTYLPRLLAGDGYYEATDALAAIGVVLVPLGAGTGAFWAAIPRPAGTGYPILRVVAATLGYVLLLLALWQVWAVLTGAPHLL